MCLSDVPNLKEINPWEGYFYKVQMFSVKRCEEEKCEENWAIFGSVYLANRQPDFFPI